jgi:hypothetical protein
MPKSVRVQFEDGTSHIYDNVPDDVDASQVETRAAGEFGKSVLTAHSPNQGAAPGAVPGQGETGPQFGDYSTLPKTAGQVVGAAQIPFQLAAEHPLEAGAAIGGYKALQLGNKYVAGQQAAAQGANDVAKIQAQTALENAQLQREKMAERMARGGQVAGPVSPGPQILGANGQPMTAPQAAPRPQVAAPVAQVAQPAQAAEQGLVNSVRQKAASMVSGLAQANPMMANAGRMASKALPFVGAAAGGLDAYNRAQSGDYLGAGLAGVGAGASFIPGVGTAVNLGTTAINAGRDYSKYLEAKRQYEEQQKKAKAR